MGRTRALRSIAILLLMVPVAAVAAEETREVRLTRPSRPGERFRVRVEATDARTVTARTLGTEGLIYDTTLCIEFDAEAEVLEVDAAGRARRIAYRVDRCLRQDDGRWVPVVPGDTVVLATRSAFGTRFDLEGTPVDIAVRQSLELAMGFDGLARDDIFGVTPQRQGERREIDAARAAEGLAGLWGGRLRPGDVDGSSTFVDEHTVEGRRCMRIRNELQVRNVLPGRDEFPSDFHLEQSLVDTAIQGLFPMDAERPPRGLSTRTNVDAVLSGAVGSSNTPVELHVHASRVVFREHIPVEPRDGRPGTVAGSN